MDTPLSSVVVVASSAEGMPEIGKAIADGLSSRGFEASFRYAADTLIPHLAACGLLIFGAADTDSLSEGDYRELFRSLKGVNFAGRYGAFFTLGSGGAFQGLSAMVKDTDLAVLEPGLVLSPGGEKVWKSAAAEWIGGIEKDLPGVPGK
jgi:hypothetical protein